MSLTARTSWILRHHWADRLGVSPVAFETSGNAVGSANKGGVQVFRRNGTSVIGTSNSYMKALDQQIDAFESGDLDDSDSITYSEL